MTALSEDEVADLARKIAELREQLRSVVADRDAAVEEKTAATLELFRLETELRAAHDRQKASAEILRSIAATSGNAEHALQQIAETTAHFFNAPSVTIRIAEGDRWVQDIRVGSGLLASSAHSGSPLMERGASLPVTVYQENRQIHIPDLDNIDPSMAHWPAVATRAVGIHTISGTPLRREGKAIGALIIYRDRLAPFTDEELALQQSFADQAVIAIENARLFNETQEALERQTATGEILSSISNSITDPAPVFEAVLDNLLRLFGTRLATIFLLRDGMLHVAGVKGDPGFEKIAENFPVPLDDRLLPGKAILTGRALQIAPIQDNPAAPPRTQKLAREFGYDALIAVPLIREGKPIGALSTAHRDPIAFSDKQIQLANSFADQAVIAIENARLFNETQESLERQTATADILKVIASSPSDVQPVFEAIAESAKRLLGCHMATVTRVVDGVVHLAAGTARSQAEREALGLPYPLSSDRIHARVARAGELAFRFDIENEPGVPESIRAFARSQGYRSLLVVPMLRHGVAIGTIGITRREAGPFADKEIDLLKTFADQAVIAIENARLFNETQEALARQTATSDILRVISSSPTDVQPVFDAIVRTAVRLIGCDRVFFMRVDGNTYSPVAGVSRDGPAPLGAPNQPIEPAENFPSRAIAAKRMLHLPDWAQIELPEHERAIRERFGVKSALYLPLLRADDCIGLLAMVGSRPNMFGETEIALAESFRDQALIAIENTRLFNETQEALERQTATADVLKVIASSPSDVQPVFDTIVSSAAKLFEPCFATIIIPRDGKLHLGATTALGPNFDIDRAKSLYPVPFDPDRAPSARAILEGRIIEISDAAAPDAPEYLRRIAVASGIGSFTFVPLIHEGKGVGTIVLSSPRVGFRLSERQLALVQTFADQAVIAIENTRLFNETQEALERQTATADILKVIASSPSDVKPVFEAIVASANRLLGGFSSTVYRFIDGQAHLQAFTPTTPEADDILKSTFPLPLDRFAPFEIAQAGHVAQIPDTETLSGEILAIARARGFRSMLFAPLVNKGRSIGIVAVTRIAAGSFADHHVQLLKTFADQAVIAIENTRLFDEVQARTLELSESLQQQTATADVLKVISRSVFDLQTVLDTLVESAYQLCGARLGLLYLRGEEAFECKAIAGLGSEEASRQFKGRPIRAGRGTAAERVILTGEVHCVENLLEDPEVDPAVKDMIRNAGTDSAIGGARSTLAVPMTRDNAVIGALVVVREETGPFPARQIEILQTFADQAVIAIENARLFDEVQAKTRDLEESLQQQTATSEVLQAISASPGELEPVFQAILENAVRLCEAQFAMLFLSEGDQFRAVARWNLPPAYREFLAKNTIPFDPRIPVVRAALTKRPVQVSDMLTDQSYIEGVPVIVAVVELGGARTLLQVPMLREEALVGTVAIYRQEVRPFTGKQIALVQNFAAQAVIAIDNARLLDELRQRTDDLSRSLDELRTAQDRLVQTEKLASLGQLTAGIAHEIKNPLNFVNNFSALSIELTSELNDLLKQAELAEKLRGELDELTALLKDNLDKVVQHGKRADSIVKNMLLHSREGSGEHRPADVNALVDESLNLAYHGARAEKPQFNVTLQRDFDPEAGLIEAFPQEITRVLLNLISNGFYAVTKRKADNGAAPFEPLVTATTKGASDHVEIRIRDNGTGIPPDVKEKMFNPFFTTKPAGEGTGLGLSMSHDIIVKQHGGTIDVETEPGVFTQFTIILPRTNKNKLSFG